MHAFRHVSPRSLLLCMLLLTALVGVACTPDIPSGVTPAESETLQPPQPLPASAWEQLALPTSVSSILGVAVSPIDPNVILACSALPHPLTLWRTTDAGRHWTRYRPALETGRGCHFSFAPDDPQRISVQIDLSGAGGQPCTGDAFYLSDDGGATWKRLPAHTSIAPTNVTGWCDLHVTRHHLFMAYGVSAPLPAPQVSLLERSDDDGASWTRADRGLGERSDFQMPQIGPDGALAMNVIHMPAQLNINNPLPPTELWMSADAGDTWRRVSALPNLVGTFLWATPPATGASWPGANQPFYVLEHEQIPSNLYRERVLMSADGHGWTLLPPLPVAGASVDRPGVLQALGVLPDGRLAIWGPDPHGDVPPPEAIPERLPAFWLWLWNPATQRWQVMPAPLKITASEGCGLCWGAQIAAGRDGLYLYVDRFDTDLLAGYGVGTTLPGVFRVRLPVAT